MCRQLKLSRYEDEIRHLKEGGGAGSDNIVLKHMVEDATRARDKLEYDYLEVNTAKLILESQLYSIRAGTTSEGYVLPVRGVCCCTDYFSSAVMLKLRQTLLDTEKHLSELKVKHSETLAELTTVQHALTTALSDLSLVDADKLEALKTLKQIAYLEHEGMEGRGELLEKVRDLEIDLRNKTSQLNTVLLEKDALSSKLAEQKDTLLEKEEAHSELKSTVAAFQGNAEGRDAALGHHVQQLTVKLDKQRTSITKQKAVSHVTRHPIERAAANISVLSISKNKSTSSKALRNSWKPPSQPIRTKSCEPWRSV